MSTWAAELTAVTADPANAAAVLVTITYRDDSTPPRQIVQGPMNIPNPDMVPVIAREMVSQLTKIDAYAASAPLGPINLAPPTPAITVDGLLSKLSAPSLANLWANASIATIRDDVRRQDLDAVRQWATIAAVGGSITADERTAIIAACTRS